MHIDSVAVLSSGSCGNSTLIRTGENSILVDAGLSCRELENRMSLFGADPSEVGAVLLTHEHTDHVRGARTFCTKYSIAAYGTRGTLALTPLLGVRKMPILASRPLSIVPFRIVPFKVRHLAADPIALTIRVNDHKIGFASDLGSITTDVVEELHGSNTLFIEANYDEEMLLGGTYPEFLKQSIKGDHGHLSNYDAGLLAVKTASEKTKEVVLVHLSRANNTPELAHDTVTNMLLHAKKRKLVNVSEHGMISGPFKLH